MNWIEYKTRLPSADELGDRALFLCANIVNGSVINAAVCIYSLNRGFELDEDSLSIRSYDSVDIDIEFDVTHWIKLT